MGEVIPHDMFKKSQDEVHRIANDEEKKSVAFKAQNTKNEDDDDDFNEDDSNEEMALFVKRFNRFMSTKSYGKRGQSSKKNPFVDKKYFECGELVHIIINYPNKKVIRTRRTRKVMRRRRRSS